MVHADNTVITLKEMPSKRPLREFSHTRSGNESSVVVRVPFGTEYGIALKTRDAGRRRMEVTIDGSKVADLIFNGGYEHEEILERFMDSEKRFKFVEASNAAVADPTSPQNGGIVVKVWRESVPPYVVTTFPKVHSRSAGFHHGGVLRGCKGVAPLGATVEASCGTQSYSAESVQCCAQTNWMQESAEPFLGLVGDRGATVEGGASSQKFGTTQWNGDLGEPLVFKFQLLGPSAVGIATSALFCTQCGMPVRGPDKFCSACGTPLHR